MTRAADPETDPKGDRRTTLQDVADRAGVSRTTASFVMNDRDDMRISEAAWERVRRAARELDYRPNIMAQSLKTQMTHTIALISDSVATSGYEGEMVRACVEASIAAKHMLIIGEFAGDDHLREHLVNGFLDRQVDGFLYASGIAVELEIPEALREQPLVMINCLPRNADVSAVVPDDADGARRAARHIVELGHRDGIWLVGETPQDKYVAADRRRGFEEELADHSIELSGSVACNWWPESAYEAVTDVLESGERPRALVCLNDRVAMGAYQALKEHAWTIPDDVTIVGFDDSPLASWLQPNLTSIATPYHTMGVRAVELLLTENHADGIHRMPMPIHVRGSSGPPRPSEKPKAMSRKPKANVTR